MQFKRRKQMAKLEKIVHGDFDQILDTIHKAILKKSASASYEEGSDFDRGDFRCAVRVYERYSMIGANRVSMSITLVGGKGEYYLSAITSGGSQGMFFKMNTFGEEAFLETISEVIHNL